MDSTELSNFETWILLRHRFEELEKWSTAGSSPDTHSRRWGACRRFLEALSMFMGADISMEIE